MLMNVQAVDLWYESENLFTILGLERSFLARIPDYLFLVDLVIFLHMFSVFTRSIPEEDLSLESKGEDYQKIVNLLF